MAEKTEKGIKTQVHVLTVFGVTVKQFRTREQAVQRKKDLEEEPFMYSKIHTWEPEEWMLPHIKFDEDKEEKG